MAHTRLVRSKNPEPWATVNAAAEVVAKAEAQPREASAISQHAASTATAVRFVALYPVVDVTTVDGKPTTQWRVRAQPDGQLTCLGNDLGDGMALELKVPYLFWEADFASQGLVSSTLERISNVFKSRQAGPDDEVFDTFAVHRLDPGRENVMILPAGEVAHYLEPVLASLGLDWHARADFITYWLPGFLGHRHIALTFLDQTAYGKTAPLDIEPKPDVVTRIFMLWRGVADVHDQGWDAHIVEQGQRVPIDWRKVVGVDSVDAQTDKSFFRVVEWGGMEMY
ncbi:hypothetical protein Q5752_005266 [Cryptotrichosporon argae]